MPEKRIGCIDCIDCEHSNLKEKVIKKKVNLMRQGDRVSHEKLFDFREF